MVDSRSGVRTGIPGRLIVVLLLLAIAVFINYIDRGNLSIAAPLLKDELHISVAQLGILLSAFFWTYAFMNLFYGWLVDRLNVNWVFAGAFLLWSAATAVTGFVHTFAMLFVLRLLLGIGEAVTFPACNKIIALNYPEEHRGLANGSLGLGLLMGPGFGVLFGGLLMARFGWRPFFIVLGAASLLWIVPWIVWMPPKGRAEMEDGTGVPKLAEFVALRSAWGTCLALFFSNYANYFLITWLPYYLVRERHFSLEKMAKVGGTAYLLGALGSTVAGWLSDKWIRSGASPSLARKTITGGGAAVYGVFFLFSVMGSDAFCIAMLTLGIFFFGVSSSNVWAISQTLAGPRAAGRWVGIQCFIGNLSGVAAPAITGFVVQRTGHFYWAFVVLAGVAFTAAATWIFFVGRVEPVIWDRELRQTSRVLRPSEM